MRRNNFRHWIKLQRKYRKIQKELVSRTDARLERKADIISRRLITLNRKWNLGIATAVLTAWLAVTPSTEVKAQDFFPSPFDLSSLDGTNGLRLDNNFGDYHEAGFSVSNAGDVNGDGIDDVIIGAYKQNANDGAAFVVFGSTSAFGATLDMNALDGSDGFVINGEGGYYAGWSVSGAGDINGDGIDDVVVGTYDNYDYSYVIFGKNTGFSAVLNVSDLDGTDGFSMTTGGYSGNTVSRAGDVNGDGVDDLIVGTYQANPSGSYEGSAYVLFGKTTAFSASVDLSALDGTTGFRIDGEEYSYAGVGAGIGDVNGDGIDDVFLGAPGDQNVMAAGTAYVVFGSSTGFSATIQATTLDGTNGFKIDGIERKGIGFSASNAGDLNADGTDDFLIGGANRSSNTNGLAFVIFGSSSGFAATLNAGSLDGANGFAINGIGTYDGQRGIAVAAGGDVNGDGISDIIIGDEYAYVNGYASGSSYVIFGNDTGFDANFELGSISAINGSEIPGLENRDFSGNSVSGAGDFNGDGLDDLIIGAPYADPDVTGYSGTAYIIFGVPRPTSPFVGAPIQDQMIVEDQAFSFELDPDDILVPTGLTHTLTVTQVGGGALPDWLTFDSGTNNLSGTPGQSDLGTISIEVTFTDTNSATATDQFDLEVLDAQEFQSSIEVSALDGTNGFMINGVAEYDYSGNSVSIIGDINGDGIDDFIVAAYYADPNGNYESGSGYVIFGTNTGFESPLELSSLNGTNGFVIDGIDTNDQLGSDVSFAGDFNGDGIGDLLVTAPNRNSNTGSTYVIFGSTSPFSISLDLSILDGTNGLEIVGAAGSYSGSSASFAGDVNGDGTDDIIIGARGANMDAGASYVVFGSTVPFSSSLSLSSLDGTNGFVINGYSTSEKVGNSVAPAGDINGDGVDDVVIGAYNYGGISGRSYVVFGSNTGFSASIGVEALDGSNGFAINGIGGTTLLLGESVSGAGDVNADGVDDIIMGASLSIAAQPAPADGTAYVLFGSTTPFSATFGLDNLDGTNGFAILPSNTGERLGKSVSHAGDVNGDGIDDVIVGAYSASPNGSSSGASYVIFGNNSFASQIDVSSLDGSNGFVLNGEGTDNNFGIAVSGAGDVNEDGVDDILIGARRASPNGNESGVSYVVLGIQSAAAPTLANPIADQNINEDESFSFVVPSNTFEDLNASDVHILSAMLSGGGSLPSWLSFDVGTNTFSGIPTNDDVGTITVEVTVTDEDGLTATDDFDIVVNNVNDAPVLTSIGDQSIDEGTELTFTATATDVDVPANTLTYSIDATSEGKGMMIDSSTADFNWTPNEDEDGAHEVTITVSDGTATNSEIVTITVNEVNTAPVLSSIGDQSVDEGTELTFTATAADSDLPANTLTFGIDATSEGKGMTIDSSTGAFSWTPDEDEDGTHDVTITVSDGTATDSETITITVNDVNSAPVLASIGDQSIDEGSTLSFTATATDSDLPANTLMFSIDATSEGKGMTIDSSTGAFSWTPEEDQDGTHDVVITVSDGITTDNETITITVGEANTAPVLASIGNQSVDEGTELTFSASATDIDLPANTLMFSIDATSVGKSMTIDSSTGAFSWTPEEDQDGTNDVTVTVSDGTTTDSETITVTVNEVNTAPVLASIGDQSIDEGTELTFIASATDVDLPANTLTYSIDATSEGKGMTIDSSTGAFNWTPGEDEDGTHDVMISVNDGSVTDSETITITVNDVNTAPILDTIGDQSIDEGIELTFTTTATDSDLPANTLTFSIDATSEGKGMSIDSATGAFSWTPDENEDGTHTVTVTVSDGITTDSETITITVSEVNTAPELASIGDQSIDEGTELTFIATATDSDLPANTLTFSVDATSEGKGMSIDPSTGTFSWTPTQGGVHDVMITVSDGTVSDSEMITITVNEVLGVKDVQAAGVSIFPNPVEAEISLKIDNEYLGELKVQVVNLNGQVSLEKRMTKNSRLEELKLNLSELLPGLYFIEIHLGQNILRQRVIKR